MKKILAYSLVMIIGFAGFGQEFSLEENYDRTFEIGEKATVDINNKYGEVIINTWYKDSVRILVTVSAKGKTRDAINKEIRRVDVDIRQVGSIISAVTEFDQERGRGFFGELLDQVSDYSQNVIGGKKITVDYEVWLPMELEINIENKFGDVYLADLNGPVSIDLSHGDLRANQIRDHLILTHSFGKFRFDNVHEANFNLRGVEGKINSAHSLNFESSSSELDLGEIQTMQLNSRNDKYEIDILEDIIGEGSFTDLSVDKITRNANLDFNYGEIFISQIEKDFGKISIAGKSCDINMILDQASYINTTIIGEEERMILPNSMLVMKKEFVPEEGRIVLSGFVGNTNTTNGILDIDSKGGELIISIKETDIFTDRN